MAQTKAQLISGASSQSVTFNDATVSSINGGPIGGARNRIINGDMRIDQRNAGSATANTINGYTVDRWVVNQGTTGKLVAQQNAGSVTPPSGFTNYLGVTSQSAYTPATSDYFQITQAIEGYNLSDLDHGTAGAKSATLSFWVRGSQIGTYGGSVYKGGGVNRSYPFSYTISTANTWTQITIPVSGDTVGGLVSTTNSTGFEVRFGLGNGSTFTGGTVNTWQSGNFVQPSGTVSVVGTNGATFYITGVQLEQGSTATPFERRSYGQELALCQRYFELTGDMYYRSYNTASAAFRMFTPFKVSKRTSSSTVTVRTVGGNDFTGGTAGSVQISGSSYGITSINTTAWSYTWETTSSPASTATHDIGWKLVVDNEL